MQGLGDEQVDVFGHHHVTDELESVSCSDLTENLNKGVASAHCSQERETPVATEGDEVQVAEAVDAFETLRHESESNSPTCRLRDRWGTRNNVLSG